MPCDRRLRQGQSLTQRKMEIKEAVAKFDRGLARGSVKAKIGPKGAIAFLGLTEAERGGVTDVCAYRLIMSSGSAQAKLAIARAELQSGTAVNKATLALGTHSHDGGVSWHDHK